MKRKEVIYHLNPKTGAINRCRAQPGKCPYEQPGYLVKSSNSKNNHYASYSEALADDTALLANFYRDAIRKSDETAFKDNELVKRYEYMDDMTEDEVMELAMTTDDERLMLAMIYGTVKHSDKMRIQEALLSKRKLPTYFVKDIVNYPRTYTRLAQSFVAKNLNLSKFEVMQFAITTQYSDVLNLLMAHPRITADDISNALKNDAEQVITGKFIGMTRNPNFSPIHEEIADAEFERLGIEPYYKGYLNSVRSLHNVHFNENGERVDENGRLLNNMGLPLLIE